MISKKWKNGEKTGIKNNPVAFVCMTNDKDAKVTLQYHDKKWKNAMTPSTRYPAGSIYQWGQGFLLPNFLGHHQSGFFRCVAKSQGNEICLKLGILFFSGEYFCCFLNMLKGLV